MNAIAPARVSVLNKRPMAPGRYVLYWMQQSQRALRNDALEYAVNLANTVELPVVVVFGLMDNYPEARVRHYAFMLEGLRETAEALADRGIRFLLRLGQPPEVALELGEAAAAIICDRGYLRHQRMWRREVAEKAVCRVVQVECDVVVPVEVATSKAEYAARTLRPRLLRLLPEFLVEAAPAAPLNHSGSRLTLPESLDLSNPETLLNQLKLDRTVPAVSALFRGGTSAGEATFQVFLQERLSGYTQHRNQPQSEEVSHMSKYLHFGQISPVWLALEARKRGDRQRGIGETSGNGESALEGNVATFLEELIVRRELAMNFVQYNERYDRYENLPSWARRTLAQHRPDPRPATYTREELESSETHDPYWNAAMTEMRCTGYMHNAMRMYWGKKILEWSENPEEAFATALDLNNKHFLDGRDANSFANISWVFGQHDRPWPERPIFGKIRYMNARGLERKCDIKGYVTKVERLSKRVAG